MKARISVGIKNGSIYVTSSGSIMTTADVGLLHELGTVNMPKRSWLYEPVQDFVDANPFNPLEESVSSYANRIKDYVIEGFSTNGHGKWAGADTNTFYYKKTGAKVTSNSPVNLVDFGKLKDDIEVFVSWQN